MPVTLHCVVLLAALASAAAADPAYHVIYVHGKAVEDGGRRPTTGYGVYEYDAILDALQREGFAVSSEQRPSNADPAVFAARVRNEVRKLIDEGADPSDITVIGASKGAVITMLASTLLQEPQVRYVILGNCNDSILERHQPRLSGRVLSIYEATDTFGQSCHRFFERAGNLTEHDEIKLTLGIGHSFLYTPNPAWLKPAAEWIRRASAP
jgi:hypothetical protein